jgi:hypothetical protein
VRRTVAPSAEIEAQIEQLLAVGVGENPRESLSELARLGARLIIQRAVEDEFESSRRGFAGPGMSAGSRISAGCAITTADCATGCARARSRPRRGARGRDPAGPRGGRDVRLQSVCQGHQAGLNGAAEGVGDRRVRARVVDARRRVAVRAARAGEAVDVNRFAGLREAARALSGIQPPRPLRPPAGRVVPGRDLPGGAGAI